MAWEKRTGIMLCQPLDDNNLSRNFTSSKTLLVQPKLDGMRAWVDYYGGEPVLISSQGNLIESVPHINLALEKLAEMMGEQVKWDGELYCHGMPFEQIISITKRQVTNLHPDYTSIEYRVFDAKIPGLTNSQRQQVLEKNLNRFNMCVSKDLRFILMPVPTENAYSEEQITDALNRYVTNGYEGIIIRNPKAMYVEKRPWTILKWKPSQFDWYKLIEVEQAFSEDGTPLSMVGALLCEDKYGNRFRAGSGLGLDNLQRKKIWNARYILTPADGPYWVKVHYQNLTKNGVPRFGKFTTITLSPENGEEESWKA